MPVAQHGWATPTEASLYFTDERPVKALWVALAADDDAKNTVLNFAYNRLYYHPDYSLPAKGAETAVEKIVLIKAQSEMAYYTLMHLEDEDRRKGIQVQGVAGAGIVKETYVRFRSDVISPQDVPIPPIVDALLDGFSNLKALGIANLDRDEDKSASTKVDEF